MLHIYVYDISCLRVKLDHQLEDIVRVGFYLIVKLVLYINILTDFGQLRAINTKLITVLYTIVLDGTYN